ncbi:MAG: class I SAM-dependent methyltransferase [Chloroflexota bacterium]
MSTEIQKRFEDAAKYDGMMAKVFPGYEQLPLVILSFLRTRIGRTAHLLDVGCGTGATLAAFATHQTEWSFIGVDPAEPMLEIARNKISAMGMEKRVTFFNGTIDALPDEPKFDASTCILVEHLQPDNGAKLRLLEGIQCRMVSGGWFVLFGLHGNLGKQKAQNALEAWLEFVTLRGLPETARDNVRHRATVEDSLIPEERIVELLQEAGFVNIERVYQLQLLGGWLAQKV